MQLLSKKIWNSGFSWLLTRHTLKVELPHPPSAHSTLRTYNEKMTDAKVSALISQPSYPCLVNSVGTTIYYLALLICSCYSVSILIFSVAGHIADYEQLSVISGPLPGSFSERLLSLCFVIDQS